MEAKGNPPFQRIRRILNKCRELMARRWPLSCYSLNFQQNWFARSLYRSRIFMIIRHEQQKLAHKKAWSYLRTHHPTSVVKGLDPRISNNVSWRNVELEARGGHGRKPPKEDLGCQKRAEILFKLIMGRLDCREFLVIPNKIQWKNPRFPLLGIF